MNFKRPSLLFQQQSQQQVSMLFEKKQHLITPLTTQVKDVRRETAGSNGENPDNFRPDYCFHFPGISDVFLPDTVTFPASFLQDPAKFGGRNLRHRYK
jgi:hypothetical protein